MKQNYLLAVAVSIVFAVASCGGGGGPKPPPAPQPTPTLSITSISLSPATVTTGTVVELTASYSNATVASSLDKKWEVSAGVVSLSAPDFGLILRETAGIKTGSNTLTTRASTVYWFTPAEPGSYTVKLTVGSASRTKSVSVTSSPLQMEVLPGEGDTTRVRVKARNVSALYQAAFRVTFDASRYRPVSVAAGSFLGGSADVLFLGLTNQSGFVPVGMTRKGNASGVSGSGELAEIVFAPRQASRSSSGLGLAGFDLSFYVLRDNRGLPLTGVE